MKCPPSCVFLAEKQGVCQVQRPGKRERMRLDHEWCPKKYPAGITRRQEASPPASRGVARRLRGLATLSYGNCFRVIFAPAAPMTDFASSLLQAAAAPRGIPS